MNEKWLGKFEDYLQNKMSAVEIQEFEAQLASNQEFGEAYELYVTIEKDMRNLLASEEEAVLLRATLQSLSKKHIKSNIGAKRKTVSFFSKNRTLAYASIAATIILLLASYAIFLGLGSEDLHLKATKYYASNLQELGQTMGNGQDTMQLAISHYNKKEYDLAINYFKVLLEKNPSDAEVLKNLGLSLLAKEEYTMALDNFEQLALRKDLFSNSGLFLQALTLLIRDDHGDKEEAKQKLQEVVATQSEGSQVASKWLEAFN